jgi:hypothetical protein
MAQSNCLSSPITYPYSTDAERQNSTTRLCWSSGLIQSVHWGMGDQGGRCGDHILYLPTPLYPAVGRCLRCTATCFLRRVLPVPPAIGGQATEASGEEGQGALACTSPRCPSPSTRQTRRAKRWRGRGVAPGSAGGLGHALPPWRCALQGGGAGRAGRPQARAPGGRGARGCARGRWKRLA